jgi:hypothetical protein
MVLARMAEARGRGIENLQSARGIECERTAASRRWLRDLRRLGDLRAFVASGTGHQEQAGVAEEARARGFEAPAFAGCAFVEVWCD